MRGNKYYFCGIGGNGMSPLARLLAAQGKAVMGSDRSYDLGRNQPFFETLQAEGIRLVPQDGSALEAGIDRFIVTRAVEDTIPDIAKAKELGLSIMKRPVLMAELFAATRNVAVGGTGGKSTTTGMIGYILEQAGMDPVVMNGAVMLNWRSNFRCGRSSTAVFEADESDGFSDAVVLCPRSVAVLTNISLDHFELTELNKIFAEFVRNASEAIVLNADCANSMRLKPLHPRVVTFGIENPADISLRGLDLQLTIPGQHNTANALAAIAACSCLGVPPTRSAAILKSFAGIQRRLELIGEGNGVKVIDDFASNPEKISAALKTLRTGGGRLFAVFQPHGFQPTKMMRQGYVEVFSTLLGKDDCLAIPEIFYVGGSVNYVDGRVVPLPRDISSRDLVEDIRARGGNAHYFAHRDEIRTLLLKWAAPGDTVIVMGSRDETLPEFAQSLRTALQSGT